MRTDENDPRDWLRSAKTRLNSADHLIRAEGVTESSIELLQEATERFLKAYLVSRGWKLARTHDLGALMAEAAGFDARFTAFEDFADSLTDQFWAQRYPGGDLTGLGSNYPELRKQAGELVVLILQSVQS